MIPSPIASEVVWLVIKEPISDKGLWKHIHLREGINIVKMYCIGEKGLPGLVAGFLLPNLPLPLPHINMDNNPKIPRYVN